MSAKQELMLIREAQELIKRASMSYSFERDQLLFRSHGVLAALAILREEELESSRKEVAK